MDNEKVLSFSEKMNSVQFLYDDDDVSIVSLDLFHIDNENESNRNKSNISLKAAKNSLKTFRSKPIIFRFNNTETDVSDHAHSEAEKNEMRIAGTIPSDSKITFIKRENGKIYCNCEAILYKSYMPKLMKILKNKDGNNRVSIEILAKGSQDKESGIFFVEYFKLRGVCLLGENVIEGIENSHLETIRFSKEEYNQLNEKYMAFSAKTERADYVYQEIKNKKQEARNKVVGITLEILRERLWKQLRQYKFKDGSWLVDKYSYMDINADEKKLIVQDWEVNEYYAIPYKVSKDGDVTIDIDNKVKIEKDVKYRELLNAFSYAKEDYGTGEPLVINKSKEAVSDKPWGEVDKTKLLNDGLVCKNYKEAIRAIYGLVLDGWEDDPRNKLKYPIMMRIGNELVYNKHALSSALGYAKKENETEVVAKVEKIQKELGLFKEKEEDNSVQVQTEENNANKPDVVVGDSVVEQNKKFADENVSLKEQIANMASQYKELEDKYKLCENKCGEFENKCNELVSQLKKYEQKESANEMKDYLNRFAGVLDDSEIKVIASKLDKVELEEYGDIANFKKFINEKIVEKVASQIPQKPINNSVDTENILFNLNLEDKTLKTDKYTELCKRYNIKCDEKK